MSPKGAAQPNVNTNTRAVVPLLKELLIVVSHIYPGFHIGLYPHSSLLLSIQSAYQSLIAKGQPFDATNEKELFQGSVQARCMLIERLDMLIKEKESHIGIDIKRESMSAYHSTRKRLQEFIQRRYHVSDLAFSQLTESFIYELHTFCFGELGHQQSIFFRVAADLKTVCRLAYREGLADTLLFDKIHIEQGDKKDFY